MRRCWEIRVGKKKRFLDILSSISFWVTSALYNYVRCYLESCFMSFYHFTFPPAMSEVLLFPHTCIHLLFVFLITAILASLKWHLIWVLLCISLMSNDIAHLFHVLIRLFVYLLRKKDPLPILCPFLKTVERISSGWRKISLDRNNDPGNTLSSETHNLVQQGSSNDVPGAKSSPLTICVVLLEQRHAHSFAYCLWLLLY